MNRKIIQIDQDKCVGCGLCAGTCQQSAIQIINGKATLMHESYCDGLGRCLAKCPVDAISFSGRDIISAQPIAKQTSAGCPINVVRLSEPVANMLPCPSQQSTNNNSQLQQWPLQIKLIPTTAPFFNGAKLLIAADCTAFAYADFHDKFIENHIVLIGCPKLDDGDYSEKLTTIIQANSIESVEIVRMEVPCCAGLANATIKALQNSGKTIPWKIITISTVGNILED